MRSRETSSVVEGDPLSMRNRVQNELAYQRGDWHIRIVTDSTLTADADRKAVYNQVQERILTTVPFASLVGRAQAFAYSKKLTGFANIPGFLTFESGYTLVGAQLQA